jgi:hypothetical protein
VQRKQQSKSGRPDMHVLAAAGCCMSNTANGPNCHAGQQLHRPYKHSLMRLIATRQQQMHSIATIWHPSPTN